jgi:hypothetical protein
MYSGTSSVPKISSGSKSRLKTKKGEPLDCNREQKKGLTGNLLSNGAFLWWSVVLLDGLLSLVRHGLGVFFFLRSRERRREVMEVYAGGFAEHRGGYFISCESALGVMTGWRTLMGIPNDRVFSSNAKGFSLNSVHGSRMRIFYGFYAKG